MTTTTPPYARGVLPIVHTPFRDKPQQEVDFPAVTALVAEQRAYGVTGFVVNGVASEPMSLLESERDAILRLVREAAGTLPVVAGIDGPTHAAGRQAQTAANLGADALMVRPPTGTYGLTELVGHLEHIARASDLPIVFQDAPQATGVELSMQNLAELFDSSSHIQAMKLEGPDALTKIGPLRERGIPIVAGWGGLNYTEAVELGASGCYPGCDLSAAFVTMHRSGSPAQRDAAYASILPLLVYEARSVDMLTASAKFFLKRRGVFGSDALRRPLRALSAMEREALDRFGAALEACGVPGFSGLAG